MKFHLDKTPGANQFTGYGTGYVSVNNQRYESSVVVAPGREVAPWNVGGFDALTAADFERLLELAPEIVIFGSGNVLKFPPPQLTRAFAARTIGFEVMDTKAACRTYNILAAEGRQVVAALLL